MPEPSFPLSTRNHFVPSPEEFGELSSLGMHKEEEITRLDNAISHFQTELAQLRARKAVGRRPVVVAHSLAQLEATRTALARQVRTYQTILAPIRRLPPELLECIFSFVHSAALSETLASALKASIRISQTCALWRSIAFGLPILWSAIHLRFNNVPGTSRTRAQSFSLILGRCTHRPLSISIHAMSRFETVYLPPQMPETLLRIKHRWRTLDLAISSNYFEMLLTAFEDQLPELRHLKLNLWWTNFQRRAVNNDSLDIAKLLRATPGLASLELRNIPLVYTADRPSFRPEQHPLESLVLDLVYSQEVSWLDTVRRTPRLKRMELLNIPFTYEVPSDGPILLSDLASLEITTEHIAETVLLGLTAPRLAHLAIGSPIPYENRQLFTGEVFSSFMSRSSCNLRSLSLRNLRLFGRDLASTLVHLAPLEELEIVSLSPYQSVIDPELTNLWDMTLPNLRHLRLTVEMNDDPRWVHTLRGTLLSRTPGFRPPFADGKAFERVDLAFCGGERPDAELRDIFDLWEAGDVSYSFSYTLDNQEPQPSP
ncbi:hypothetical protein PUNSTDRAFT_127782 [Punctularia strigosozonata HHB-11173 SS5]|uniref:uncharacterized protein n=1 Tax=Punctularia strigosozonata (strain HHB-11173) TaxID=741275 RepID=UPI0004417ED6|nr:uncharacterized protein PUNSTDRAFT_127782 [Punctularia strigosozonata HHB-11173 SS5]EIN05866.1 hypothetical protein PUNSTDRAFT_127782 [Punctularia strigosozonata HHB-11173 SS5]